MNTKSYSYNEAVRDVEKYGTAISNEDVLKWVHAPVQGEKDTIAYSDNWWKVEKEYAGSKYNELIRQCEDEIKETGAFPYLSVVSRLFLAKMGHKTPTDDEVRRVDSVVYNTNQYYRANATIKNYNNMFAQGYKSADDMEAGDNGKKAIITGTKSADMFTVSKDNEKVVLVYTTDNRKGYKTPRMRTRFYSFGHGSDMFYKLIEA